MSGNRTSGGAGTRWIAEVASVVRTARTTSPASLVQLSAIWRAAKARARLALMTDIKLFALHHGDASKLPGRASPLEESLQQLIERNLESMLGLRLLSSEDATSPL